MKSSLVKVCLLLVLVRLTKGNMTSQCSTSDSYWEVQQDKRNNTFTCTGLTAQDTIEWYVWKSSTDYFYLGNCKPLTAEPTQFVCDNSQGQPIFIASRTSADAGLMVINPVAGGDASLYQDSRLLCYATRSGTVVGKASCRFDYIHASEDTSCTVQFRNDTWSVYGQCNIQKAYSVQNRYRCEWIQTKEF
ncbi:uncharacterized protein LOC112567582 [Pomacea canaliculata]|uniref:uncharacterized protein LOC112567582 n=1 Tax=Pomacea canaliculata TaxID=400727 RepID=UPI000D72BD7E|nr:uncharacterized protein LOC112567582 [Pomacea canaliculata]